MKGYKIKKGWNINIDARSIHLDPDVYNEPHKFNPLRFEVSQVQHNACKVNIFKFYISYIYMFIFLLNKINLSKGGSKSKQFLSIWDGRKNMSWTCYGQSHDVSISPPFYYHLQVRTVL